MDDTSAGRLTWSGDDVPILTADASSAGVKVAFTCRHGGVSRGPYASLNLSGSVGDDKDAVARNRMLVEEACGFAPDSITLLKQVHEATVVEVPAGSCGVIGEGDALITDGGATVGVLTADCVPVLLAGRERVAAVHAGWRGLVAGVIEAALAKVEPVVAAWVGPSIRACCYEVGDDVRDAFRAAGLPGVGRTTVDPVEAAVAVLCRSGVDEVVTSDHCTSCDDRFFSYRRDGTCGRQGAFIAPL